MEAKSSPVKIDQKIKGYSVVLPDSKPAAVPTKAEVERIVVEAPPYERPDVVTGTTYKIRPPVLGHAMYITINDIVTEDGKFRPIEMFINTKHVEHFQWIAALTRVISALLRKPGDYLFVIDELLQVYDPQGGYWSEGKMMPSVVAEIGTVFKKHCQRIGALEAPALNATQMAVIADKQAQAEAEGVEYQRCGKCGEQAALMMGGCLTCTSCGDSKCG
ncbi:MAG TPA: hypothetical protein VGD46_00520 [Rhizobacter sp.]